MAWRKAPLEPHLVDQNFVVIIADPTGPSAHWHYQFAVLPFRCSIFGSVLTNVFAHLICHLMWGAVVAGLVRGGHRDQAASADCQAEAHPAGCG